MHSTLARALTLLIIALGLTAFAQSPATAFADRDCGDFPSQAGAQTLLQQRRRRRPARPRRRRQRHRLRVQPLPLQHGGGSGGGGGTTPNPVATLPAVVYRETGNVIRIIDGDTLKVDLRAGGTVSVRMLGINTPEDGRCGDDEATENLEKLAPVGSTVDLVSDPHPGRQGPLRPAPALRLEARRLQGPLLPPGVERLHQALRLRQEARRSRPRLRPRDRQRPHQRPRPLGQLLVIPGQARPAAPAGLPLTNL